MLGPVKCREGRLFYVGFRLEDRVPLDHPLRAVLRAVEFSFVRREVSGLYGDRGNESVDRGAEAAVPEVFLQRGLDA